MKHRFLAGQTQGSVPTKSIKSRQVGADPRVRPVTNAYFWSQI